jgi:hypothetical protein
MLLLLLLPPPPLPPPPTFIKNKDNRTFSKNTKKTQQHV